jgi:predicted amidohydrolase
MLSKTKISYMYTPGSMAATFEVEGYRFGCALGMECHFPEIFMGYEALDVDCVLFSTTGGLPGDAPLFAASTCGHAANNNYWISFSVPSEHSLGAPSGIVRPNGAWAARCPANGSSAIALFDISVDSPDYSRTWRRAARSGIYAPHRVDNDQRSDDRGSF